MNKETLKKACNSIINKEQEGIKTGFGEINQYLSGLEKGSLITIGARPSMGKTTLAMTFMENFIKEGKKCLYFSTEMSVQMFTQRLILQYAEISVLIKSPLVEISPECEARLNSAVEALSKFDYCVCDESGFTVEDVENKIEEYKPDYVFIDYLQMINYPKKLQRVDALCEIMKKLKITARKNNVTIFALSQLSRAVESRCDKRPMLSDLRESGAIENISDAVVFIYRDDYYYGVDDEYEDISKRGVAKIIIAKNKFGPIGETYSKFMAQIPKFIPMEKTNVFKIGQ